MEIEWCGDRGKRAINRAATGCSFENSQRSVTNGTAVRRRTNRRRSRRMSQVERGSDRTGSLVDPAWGQQAISGEDIEGIRQSNWKPNQNQIRPITRPTWLRNGDSRCETLEKILEAIRVAGDGLDSSSTGEIATTLKNGEECDCASRTIQARRVYTSSRFNAQGGLTWILRIDFTQVFEDGDDLPKLPNVWRFISI